MIKTNEVRRGNLVAYAIKDSKGNVPAAFKKPLIVDEIRDSFFMITDNLGFEMQFAESQLEGVPLTPGILKAMGFIWKSTDEGPQCEMKGTDFVLFDDGSVGVGGWVYSDFVHVGNSAKFLHQLQNLFFALTGEELNIPYKTF